MKREKPQRYASDRPISRFPQDQLGRTAFARRLADDIIAWNGNDSLVVALYGDWGSGKTSVKNLMVSALKQRRTKIPIVDFNPWQLSGSGGISDGFFTELRIAVGAQIHVPDEAKQRAKDRLDKYSKRLSFGGAMARVLAPLLTAIGRSEEAAAVLVAAKGLKQASDITKTGSEVIDPEKSVSDLPLAELKSSLEESLRALRRPMLVVIDDIDRLTASEILDVFQLVKANADFPNLIYLLLFERSIVSKALDAVSDGRGAEFLEKIIQVGYHVPHASRESVQKVLFSGLDEYLALPGVARRWDKNRWSELYLDGLAPFFRNLRHVYRFLSSFGFHVRQFQTGGHFEVNAMDLIALETLRVFEPSVFENLAANKRILTRDTGRTLFGRIEQDAVDAVVDAILASASAKHRDHVRRILRNLFPPISKSYAGEQGTGGDSSQWLRDARVCHPEFFDRYLTLAIDERELAQSDLESLLDCAGDSLEFAKQMDALRHRGLLLAAFEHLDAYKEDVSLDKMPSVIRALSDISDSFPRRAPGMFETEARMMAARMVYFGLRREKDEARRLAILLHEFAQSSGVLLPVLVTSLQERRAESNKNPDDYLVTENGLEALKELAVEKLRAAAKDGRLRQHVQADMLLWRWSDWDFDSVRGWVRAQVATTDGALWLLSTLLGEVHSHGRELKTSYHMKLSTIERFADVEAIKNALADAKLPALAQREEISLREFYRALKRRAEGKPETDGLEREWEDDEN